jgi:iron complex transport system permease protein
MRKRYLKWGLFLVILVVLVIFAAIFSISVGEMDIRALDIPKIFRDKSGIEYAILTKIRLPRTILAFAVGGALSLTGAILQGIYRNPLVEPYTLGISGGAALGVALAIVMGIHLTSGAIILPMAGFAGAFLTIFLVYSLSFRRDGININRMLLIGVMISFVSSSLMMFLMAVTTTENLHGIIFWIMGSLDEPNVSLVKLMLIASIVGLFVSYLYARPLNALRLGEAKAMHLGVNSNTTVRILFITASVLTGICVSVAGIIGFVGLIIPHIIRMLIGSDYRFLLLGSFLGGSLFLILCDVVARTVIAPNELPIGVITGIAGGVVFILALSKSKLIKTKMD